MGSFNGYIVVVGAHVSHNRPLIANIHVCTILHNGDHIQFWMHDLKLKGLFTKFGCQLKYG